MNQIQKTGLFTKWLLSLKDTLAKVAIIKHIERATQGNFGDHKSVGEGVYEMRITVGAGYRVYYGQQGKTLYLLLCGGNKASQEADIMKAKLMWQQLKQENHQ